MEGPHQGKSKENHKRRTSVSMSTKPGNRRYHPKEKGGRYRRRARKKRLRKRRRKKLN